MGMRKVFQNAAVTAMKVAGDITRPATYREETDNGFGDVEKLEKPCKIIFDEITDKEASRYSFASLIQMKDKIGMIATANISVPINTQNKIVDEFGVVWTIVAKDEDAADALYVLLLRKV
jgi:hypothetical protein